jgi:hypothetical protein
VGRNAADIKSSRVGDKMKEGMEKEKRVRERRKTWGSRQKRKGWFSRWRYGRSRCAGFAGDIQGTEAASRGVRKRTEQTRFRWQWSECFREDERDRKQILNKGFKNETLQKILNVKQELLKLNSAVQQQGKKKRQSESNKRV